MITDIHRHSHEEAASTGGSDVSGGRGDGRSLDEMNIKGLPDRGTLGPDHRHL